MGKADPDRRVGLRGPGLVLEGALSTFRGEDSLTITDALESQACDDKLWHNPVIVALSWTAARRPLDMPWAARP